MKGETISRAAVLLQYYAALGELMEEGALSAKAASGPAAHGERTPDSFGRRNVESQPAA